MTSRLHKFHKEIWNLFLFVTQNKNSYVNSLRRSESEGQSCTEHVQSQQFYMPKTQYSGQLSSAPVTHEHLLRDSPELLARR